MTNTTTIKASEKLVKNAPRVNVGIFDDDAVTPYLMIQAAQPKTTTIKEIDALTI